MDWQKRCKSNSRDSVIGKLMGFDKLWAPQKPSLGKHRVLSERYVRSSASVGLRPGSLVATELSQCTKKEIVHQRKDKSGLLISRVKNAAVVEKCVKSSASKVKEGIQSQKHSSASRHSLRYLQKRAQDSLSDHLGAHGVNYIGKPLDFLPDTNIARDSFKHECEKGHRHAACQDLVVNGVVSRRMSCSACTRFMSRTFQQDRPRSKFDELSRTGYMGDKHVVDDFEGLILSSPDENDFKSLRLGRYCQVDKSSSANVSKKNELERSNSSKEVQEVELRVRGQDLDNMLPLSDSNSLARNSLCSLPIQSTNSGSCSPSAYSLIDFWEDGYKKSLPIFKFEALKEALSSEKQYESTARNNYPNKQMISRKDILESKGGMEDCTATSGDPELEMVHVVLSADREHSSYIQEVIGEEGFLNECSEEDSSYSNGSRISPSEFQDNLKRTYQQSPDSVLEQFNIQKFKTENLDSIGLLLQLEALDIDSEETYSEGSVVLLSGDEDLDERLNDVVYDSRRVKTWLENSRSMNYSYMVDVLDEAGFSGLKPFTDFRAWQALECPISPSVFMALEKKYGKQTTWAKIERQLLFDRINSGLVSIFNQGTFFRARSSCGFRLSLRRDEVEDELWTMLMGQEDETGQGLSEKALDKWCPIEEGFDIVCEELETLLFDELVMELACL